jgi:hypothetical protein
VIEYVPDETLLADTAHAPAEARSDESVQAEVGPSESQHPMLCFQHGGSEACEAENKAYGFTCPKCDNETLNAGHGKVSQ